MRSDLHLSAGPTLLVTSGLGNQFGGIGVVAELVRDALAPIADVHIVRNQLELPRVRRAAGLAIGTLRHVAPRPAFLFYDHMNLARISCALPWLLDIPYGVFLHGAELWRALDPFHRRALTRATLLVANSQFTVDEARRYNPWLPHAAITWLGVDARHTVVQAGPRPARAVIVGRMDASERRKGHDLLLESWSRVTASVPGAGLDVVGDGDDRERLATRARSLGLGNVRFHGRLDDAAKNRIYATSRVFAFPSLQEGFGLAAVEAALHGCALLGLRGTVLEELFPDGTGAVFAAEPTPSSIEEAIAPVLGDENRARDLGERARARAEALFRAEHFVQRFRDLLSDSR